MLLWGWEKRFVYDIPSRCILSSLHSLPRGGTAGPFCSHGLWDISAMWPSHRKWWICSLSAAWTIFSSLILRIYLGAWRVVGTCSSEQGRSQVRRLIFCTSIIWGWIVCRDITISWKIRSSIIPLQIPVYFSISSSKCISSPLSSPSTPLPSRTQLLALAFKLLHFLYLQSKLFAILHTFWLPAGTCIQGQTEARQTHIASVPWKASTPGGWKDSLGHLKFRWGLCSVLSPARP